MGACGDSELERIERHYRQIYRHLDPDSLSEQDADWPGEENDARERAEAADGLFLGFYSLSGLRLVFERYGLVAELARLGFDELEFALDEPDAGYDVLRITSPRVRQPLVELVAQVAPPPAHLRWVAPAEHRFLQVRWLRMQNPLQRPDPARPLLPGQSFPGLGIGREMLVLLQLISVRLGLDGMLELPERMHNAVLYFRHFRFVQPEMQGQLTAILRDTRDRSLYELAWGVESGDLLDCRSGKPFRWIGAEQVLARRGPVKTWIESAAYRERATEAMEQNRFRLSRGDLTVDLLGAGQDLTENPIPDRIK